MHGRLPGRLPGAGRREAAHAFAAQPPAPGALAYTVLAVRLRRRGRRSTSPTSTDRTSTSCVDAHREHRNRVLTPVGAASRRDEGQRRRSPRSSSRAWPSCSRPCARYRLFAPVVAVVKLDCIARSLARVDGSQEEGRQDGDQYANDQDHHHELQQREAVFCRAGHRERRDAHVACLIGPFVCSLRVGAGPGVYRPGPAAD